MTAESPSPARPLLSTDGLTLVLGARTLVEGLTFELAAGERMVLVGGNGSGKTTLLSALAGLRDPSAGTVRRPPTPPGILFQDGGLWPHMTVDAHLAFVDTRDDRRWRDRVLDALRLSSLRDRRPEALSGGERLRLGLARALAGRPVWLLLDEPLGQLDPEVAAAVRETLPELADELGAATITVTHDPDDVLLLGETLLALGGDGTWWCGRARFALESPPTGALAAFSDRGTVLEGVADAAGVADLGLGLTVSDLAPDQRARAYLDAAAVRLADEATKTNSGSFVAPDRRGGSWLRIDGRLVRSSDSRGPLQPGDEVAVRIEGRPRLFPPAAGAR